jgi:hypothetical protein
VGQERCWKLPCPLVRGVNIGSVRDATPRTSLDSNAGRSLDLLTPTSLSSTTLRKSSVVMNRVELVEGDPTIDSSRESMAAKTKIIRETASPHALLKTIVVDISPKEVPLSSLHDVRSIGMSSMFLS